MHQIYSVYTEVVIICLRSLMLTHIRITLIFIMQYSVM